MSAFFKEEDFQKLTGTLMQWPEAWTILKNVANETLEANAIKGFAQKHRGEWSFTERPMKGDTHNALLVNLGAIEPCMHPLHMVYIDNANGVGLGFGCGSCGAELESLGFVEKKK